VARRVDHGSLGTEIGAARISRCGKEMVDVESAGEVLDQPDSWVYDIWIVLSGV